MFCIYRTIYNSYFAVGDERLGSPELLFFYAGFTTKDAGFVAVSPVAGMEFSLFTSSAFIPGTHNGLVVH